jgi:hypothetical protein
MKFEESERRSKRDRRRSKSLKEVEEFEGGRRVRRRSKSSREVEEFERGRRVRERSKSSREVEEFERGSKWFEMFEKCENAYRKGNEYHKRDA